MLFGNLPCLFILFLQKFRDVFRTQVYIFGLFQQLYTSGSWVRLVHSLLETVTKPLKLCRMVWWNIVGEHLFSYVICPRSAPLLVIIQILVYPANQGFGVVGVAYFRKQFCSPQLVQFRRFILGWFTMTIYQKLNFFDISCV